MADSSDVAVLTKSAFYWDLDVFKVENRLFRVPRQWFLESSDVFSDMFSLPKAGATTGVEGQSEENPIVLEGVSAVHFEALIRVLHPRLTEVRAASIDLSRDEWIGVLSLATAWNMRDIRDHAIEELSNLRGTPLDGCDKIRLGCQYRVPKFLIDGIFAVVTDQDIQADALAATGASVPRFPHASSPSKVVWLPTSIRVFHLSATLLSVTSAISDAPNAPGHCSPMVSCVENAS